MERRNVDHEMLEGCMQRESGNRMWSWKIFLITGDRDDTPAVFDDK